MINPDFPIIGSHNTMTYLEPKSWFWKIFRFMARCQRKTYKEQYLLYDVRAFDLRLYFDDDGRCWFKHGPVWYKTFSILEILTFFNEMGDCYVRILLEETKSDSKKDNAELAETRFKSICNTIENLFPNVRFLGGERKYDWKNLYQFKYEKEHGWPRTTDLYSSTTCLFLPSRQGKDSFIDYLDDWWPWLYAKLKNKKNFRENLKKKEDIDLFWTDFVDIR